jgi:hydrogenase-4 membrane subunit HyfE
MNGFFASDLSGTVATWVAALATIATWSYLVGARRLFVLMQHLLAGLATGYLVLLAIRDVLVPRLITPLIEQPRDHVLLVPAVALVATLIGATWLPRGMTAPAGAILVGGIAAFALGGAVVGTVLPQIAAALPTTNAASPDLIGEVISLAITSLVLLAFLHGAPRGRLTIRAATVGRWLLVGGIGGWLGFLIVSRLSLLVDRIGFLLGDWLTVLR